MKQIPMVRLEVLVVVLNGITSEALVDRVQPIKDLLEALRILMLLEVVAVLEELAQPVFLEQVVERGVRVFTPTLLALPFSVVVAAAVLVLMAQLEVRVVRVVVVLAVALVPKTVFLGPH